jgi:hypothetical protein
MKKILNTILALFFSFSSLAQIITHSVPKYELKFTSGVSADSKKSVEQKAFVFFSGYCEKASNNSMILDVYYKEDQAETLLIQLFEKKVDKENKGTTYYGRLIDCEKTSLFYSNEETIVIMFSNNSLAFGFAKVNLFLKNYTTNVEY